VVTHAWRVRNGKIVQWFSFADELEALSFLGRHP
jgi:ketosteroid isomerase-like protein